MASSIPVASGLRFKIILTILIGALVSSGLLIFFIFNYLNSALTRALIEQGKIVGSNLSEFAAEKLVEDDLITLKRFIEKYRHYTSIEYLIVEDFNREVKTDTYNGNVPVELLKQNRFDSAENQQYYVEMLAFKQNDELHQVYDILVPIKDGLMGFVRVGMKKTFVDTEVRRTLLFIGLIIGGTTLLAIAIALFLITVQVTRPVLKLTEAARNISLGKLSTPVEIEVKNELLVLAEAIDRMRESLRTCLDKLKTRQVTRI